MKTILLIDDDLMIHALVEGLLPENLLLRSCHTLAEGARIVEEGHLLPALILIDRQLPDGDGLTLCARIRQRPELKATPIIFLSGQGAEADKVSGLYAGADDYVTKPFGPLELRARIETRLRKSADVCRIGGVTMDLQSQRARREADPAGVFLDLTRIEFRLLFLFAKSPERVFSRAEILDRVWGDNLALSDRVVDAHISHLRKKLQGCDIEITALRGEGYRLSLVPTAKRGPQAA